MLAALDVTKCGELYERRADVALLFTANSASFFIRTSLGISANKLENDSERKSISTERYEMWYLDGNLISFLMNDWYAKADLMIIHKGLFIKDLVNWE